MSRKSSGSPTPFQRAFSANPADIKQNSNVVLTRFSRQSSTADEKGPHAYVQALVKRWKTAERQPVPCGKRL